MIPFGLAPIAMATLVLAQWPAQAQQTSCRGEAALRSLNSNISTQLTFINRTKKPVSVYWLDFGGVRVRYQVLEAGASYTQQTYLTHPWVVVDLAGRCRGPFMPRRQFRRIVVS